MHNTKNGGSMMGHIIYPPVRGDTKQKYTQDVPEENEEVERRDTPKPFEQPVKDE